MKSELECAVDNYNTALYELEKVLSGQDTQPVDEKVFDVLISRDLVQRILRDRTKYSSKSLSVLARLDSRLRSHGKIIAQVLSQLFEQDSLVPPPKEAWWWSFEIPKEPSNWSDKFSWFWYFYPYALLGLIFSLAFELTSRFISGIDFQLPTEIVTAIIAGVFTLIPSLPKVIEFLLNRLRDQSQVVENFLIRLRIPRHLRNEFISGAATFVLVMLTISYLNLPAIAAYYNDFGVKLYKRGQLTGSESMLKRAVALAPSLAEPHYNLGVIYEKILDFKHAQIEYQLAVQLNFSGAYNRLARLYILDNKHSEAVTLLVEGLKYVNDTQIEYAIHKNLGWARLEQKRYEQAEAELRHAIDLNIKQASAYCLLAQTLETQSLKEEALREWENCLRYATVTDLDQDKWIGMAQQRLKVNNR